MDKSGSWKRTLYCILLFLAVKNNVKCMRKAQKIDGLLRLGRSVNPSIGTITGYRPITMRRFFADGVA